MSLKQELAFYKDEGFNIIALKQRDKLPDFRRIPSWDVYKKRLSTPEERALWWPSNPAPDEGFPNVAVITGAISGNLVVFDIDNEDAYRALWEAPQTSGQNLLETATVETGKGFHLYVRMPAGTGPIFTVTHPASEDALHHIKAEGGYVVAPPSIHPSGRIYNWVNRDFQNWTLDDFITQLTAAGFVRKQLAADEPRERGHWGRMFDEVISEGGRATHLTQLAGFLRSFIKDESAVRAIMRSVNKDKCHPPMKDGEVDAIVNSVYRRYKSAEEALVTDG